MHAAIDPSPAPDAPEVRYCRDDPRRLLAADGTLAVFGFGADAVGLDDPRYLRLALEPADDAARGVVETWHVAGRVESGRDDAVRWSRGGGWLFAATELESPMADAADAAAAIYARLDRFFSCRDDYHVVRMWNFIAGINDGDGDNECYKRFCVGRGRVMDRLFPHGYPAATAVGHHDPARPLQVCVLAANRVGERVENPRQLSAWRYPRQYGPVSPSFARAMRLPAGDALAISGTAAISGHASRHDADLEAQLEETLVNLESLLAAGAMPAPFDARAWLRAYVRAAADAPRVAAFLDRRLPDTPRLILEADICRRELLVEIDGWRFA